MHSEPDGTRPGVEEERPSLYALVIYLPEPLCGFLDDLRLELVPGCNPHAHISVEGGTEQLRQMHRSLNRGALALEEPYPYHPHVTLAQEFEMGHLEALLALASRRWREFRGPRRFRAESTMFVRNTRGDEWVDLASGPLRAAPVSPLG